MGLFNDVELPPIKNGDLIKIKFTLEDVRVATIRLSHLDERPHLIATFDGQYIYHVEENELYCYSSNNQGILKPKNSVVHTWRDNWCRMGSLSTWEILALYRYKLDNDGYMPYYTRYEDNQDG